VNYYTMCNESAYIQNIKLMAQIESST